jgi:hypothetical protein
METTVMTGKRNDIEIGDLVRKTNSTDWIWQVAAFVTPTGHQPHARLVRINYPSDERMFAVAALRDRRLFVEATDPRSRLATRPPMHWEPQAQA